MTAPGELTLAKGRRKIGFIALADKPADWSAISLATDASKIIDISSQVARSDFTLGFTDSDKVDDAPLDTVTNVQALDADNFEAKMSVYRYLDTGGAAGTLDTAWAKLGKKGVRGWLIERVDPLPLATVAWAVGDKIKAFPVVTDNPQPPSDLTGYVKRVVPFNPDGDVIDGTFAA